MQVSQNKKRNGDEPVITRRQYKALRKKMKGGRVSSYYVRMLMERIGWLERKLAEYEREAP